MTNKENFLKLVSENDTQTMVEVKSRIKNRAMLRESQQISIKVLIKLDELGWTQKDLAREMKVTPQQITKLVSGKQNLTIETQIKLQNILNIPVLASYYEDRMNAIEEKIITIEKSVEKLVIQTYQGSNNYQDTKSIKIDNLIFSAHYSQFSV
ncbi:helix-turn-helix domain-containing protein [Brumimicrobium glaciale]|uniref:Helix-turn-helix domain-containing protein n=1 Tax=Brumimicrobium glaciale TaxID=200475 RepID=A0A4Q4KK15_9FLAO|nr:helix-turn-helix domain-containing protein [Brumimicrobium glaciale]RYM33308.1 helix-turn-helix domain-containing protein [Brumimicrobium glaciale]